MISLCTVSIRAVLREFVPSLAVTGIEYVPGVRLPPTVMARDELPLPGEGIKVGVSVAEIPAGTLDVLSASELLYPLLTVVVTVSEPDCPAVIVIADCVNATENVGSAPARAEMITEAPFKTPLYVAVTATLASALTPTVEAIALPLTAPEGMFNVLGVFSTCGLELVNWTAIPPPGAAWFKLTVI